MADVADVVDAIEAFRALYETELLTARALRARADEEQRQADVSKRLIDARSKEEAEIKKHASSGGALGALAKNAGAVAGAFFGVVGAVSGAVATVEKLGSAASPGLGKAFGEALEYTTALLGQAFAPVLLTLGASVLTTAESFKESTKAVAEWTAKVAAWGGEMFDPTKGTRANIKAMADMLPEGHPLKGRARELGTQPSAFDKMLDKMISAAELHSGQGPPRFESATEAYKRIQMAEAGTSDIKKDTIKLWRETLDELRKLRKGGVELNDDKGQSFGGSNWG